MRPKDRGRCSCARGAGKMGLFHVGHAEAREGKMVSAGHPGRLPEGFVSLDSRRAYPVPSTAKAVSGNPRSFQLREPKHSQSSSETEQLPKARGDGPSSQSPSRDVFVTSHSKSVFLLSPSVGFLSIWVYPFKRVIDSYCSLSTSSSTSNQI